MVSWPSAAATPPSTMWPPGSMPGQIIKWLPRSDIPAGPHVIHTTAGGRPMVIVELRGWLSGVNGSGGSDPDWHFHLRLDTEWMRAAGIDPVLLCRPGDAHRDPADDPYQMRRTTWDFGIHLELDGWPRSDERGNPAKPSDWHAIEGLPSDKPGVVYAYDPRLYAHSFDEHRTVTVGDYVSVWGSLVTDDPHAAEAQPHTAVLLANGVAALRALLSLDPDKEHHVRDAAWHACAWIWGGDRAYDDPLNAARWNEIHSPDYFEKLEHEPQKRFCYQVIACSRRGPDDPEKLTYTTVLKAPPNPGAGAVLRYQRFSTPWTCPQTVQVAVSLRESGPDAGVTVSVTLLSQGIIPVDAKYCELFELWWETPAKHGGDAFVTMRHAAGDWVGASDLSVTLGVSGVVSEVAVAAHPDRDDSQVALINNGQVLHAARSAAGSWTAAGDLTGAAGFPTGIRAVTAAMLADGSAHFIGLDAAGKAWHTIRAVDGSWQPAGDLSGALGITDPVAWASATTAADAAALDVTLVVFKSIELPDPPDDVGVDGAHGEDGVRRPVVRHPVLRHTLTSQVVRTVRSGDGSWGPVQDLTAVAGLAGALRVAAIQERSAPVAVGPLLVSVGRDRRVRLTRWPQGQTAPVTQDISGNFFTGFPDAALPALAAAADGSVQVTVLTHAGQVLHGIRAADGTWTAVGDASGAAHLPMGATALSAGGLSGGAALYVAVV